uniref:ADP-ribosylation factor-like protein 6-interacting protein 1 n=1 Tax=Lepeophtheirus salmonis TaxID=72036 RepID=D3PIR8_LEPSM|nr:ADP-ribosylation factor-like protein 6-interacting protein 1 [Lepeophtheirus salmonis]
MEVTPGTIKYHLSDWREIILLAESILKWERKYYPGIILLAVSIFYSIIWLWDPSMVTLFSVFGMIIVSADYFVPRIMSQILEEHLVWTGPKEKRYDEVCEELAILCTYPFKVYSFLSYYKDHWPITHFFCTAATLLSISWLGMNVDNVLIFYISTLFVLLWPGFSQLVYMQKYVWKGLQKVVGLFRREDAHKKTE